LAGLAAITSRVRLGTMVSPATFRPAAVLAKNVVTVDQISGGRAELGIGAGWNEREHALHGLPFPPTRERVRLLREQVETILRHWTNDDEVQPKPVQKPHPPLIVGGTGKPGTLLPAARFADEYNTFGATVAEARTRRGLLDDACKANGRDPATIRFTLMTTFALGDDGLRRTNDLLGRVGPPPASWIAGSLENVVAQLGEYADARVEAVYLQHLVHEDLETVEAIGRELAPAVAAL
jgi:alkanesulfonate monooxygenase SsuD/methylene tetrahydromethanopterin reductase-like flavin-dependent oxidoreductase (luciferase family)